MGMRFFLTFGKEIRVLSKEQIQAVADIARAGKQIGQNVLVDLLDGCAEAIDHYQGLAARWVADEDKTAYHPFLITHPESERQVLIQVFTDEHGGIELVQMAVRDTPWESWGPPVSAVKA
jgi:hypothetical protein